MAKKGMFSWLNQYTRDLLTPAVSKRSRAARRGYLEDDVDEGRDLAKLPKVESDVKSSIIRTTIKNENLLAKKMENLKIRKDRNKKKTSTLKHKVERSAKVEGVLATKISQSIERHKYVHTTRKAGWEKINGSIDVSNSLIETPVTKTAVQIEREEEDAYVASFFDSEEKQAAKVKMPANAFALLEEEEA